tara:strand:+ start:221645 stop:222076 length:432 start_codon:yes stop_codon:yes gene_type:complete
MIPKIALLSLCLCTLTGCYGRAPLNLSVETACPSSPNCVSTLTTQANKQVIPYTLIDDKTGWNKLIETIQSLPRTHIVKSDANNLHAEFTSKIFRFTDDVVMRKTGGTIDIRSSSRIGYSDLGANHTRIEYLRNKLKELNIIK